MGAVKTNFKDKRKHFNGLFTFRGDIVIHSEIDPTKF